MPLFLHGASNYRAASSVCKIWIVFKWLQKCNYFWCHTESVAASFINCLKCYV